MEFEFNYLAVLVAALSVFAIGGLWYGALFAKTWQKLAGVSDEQLKKGMPMVFGGSFVMALVLASLAHWFFGSNLTAMEGAQYAVSFGAAVIVPVFGINYLFERKPFGLYLINVLYNVIALGVMGAILGAF